MKRIVRAATYVLAVIYFLVDAVFAALTRPISKWLARHFEMRWLRSWIRSLPPYPSLALFSVPVILLEPIKPLAAYMAATGQLIEAALTFLGGEVLKLVLVERLFCLTRDKLMRIPAFAWAYGHYTRVKAWLTASEAWQRIQALRRAAFDHLQAWRESASRRFAWDHRR
ncbi:MAG: hypothetical protein JOZ74_06585 [Bradyrhizobium sp.]|nr:hypothetical protein [Bradyrhizobium sp.]